MPSFHDLGLSSYEEKVYVALLELRTGDATAISETSGVPMGRIYDVLGALESRRLLERKSESRPRIYSPVEPETVIGRLLEERTRELDVEQTRYENVAAELRSEYRGRPAMEGWFWEAADTKEIAQLLADRMAMADRDVAVTATTAAGGLFGFEAIYANTIEPSLALLERGVTISLLVTESLVAELPERLTIDLDQLLREYDQLKLRTTSELYNTYDMIDRRDVCIYVADPFDRDSILGTVRIADPEFVERVEKRWQSLWNNANTVDVLADTDC
jgi:sugar-specific transcriptional regulator TrmB